MSNCAISERLYAGLCYNGSLKISVPDFGVAERTDQRSGRSQKYPPLKKKKMLVRVDFFWEDHHLFKYSQCSL